MLSSLKLVASKLPPFAETFLVLFLAFGLSVVSQLVAGPRNIEMSSVVMTVTIGEEILLGTIVVAFLYLRGLKLWKGFPFTVTLTHVGLAIGLIFLSYFGYAFLYNIAVLGVGLDPSTAPKLAVTANIFLILAISLINPLFEETFVTYYLYEKFKSYGPVIFITVSSLIRVSYHLYQGWIGVVSILPLGIVFAVTFWKTKNLMPLYLAHALQDLMGLVGNSRS